MSKHPDLTWICSRCLRERIEGQPHVCKTTEERLAELQEAARAFLDALDHGDCDTVWSCSAATGDPPVCNRTATQMFLYDALCDEHAAEHRAEHPGLDLKPRELSFGPALRRLRALLAG